MVIPYPSIISPDPSPESPASPEDPGWTSTLQYADYGGFRTLSPQDMINFQIEEPEWLIEDLLPKGYLAVLSGPPKSGKGLLTLDMISSVAEGGSFLGKRVERGPVIYVSAEEPLAEIRKRLFGRIEDGGVHLPIHTLPVDGTFGQSLKFENSSDVSKMERVIQEVNPVLVVLDVLRMMNDLEENDSDDMSRIMSEIRGLARTSGASIVANHHMNKNGVQRGSNAIAGGADITIDLTPTGDFDNSLSATLTAKGRSVPAISLPIRFDGEPRWHASHSGTSPVHPKLTNKNKILNHLREADDEQSVKEIAEATGTPERSVGTVISDIKKTDPGLLLESSGEGQGSLKRYRLAPDEDEGETTGH